jgi:hypothetical protein
MNTSFLGTRRDLKANRAHPANRDRQDLPAPLDRKAQQDLKVPRDFRGLSVRKVTQALRVQSDHPDRKGLQAL